MQNFEKFSIEKNMALEEFPSLSSFTEVLFQGKILILESKKILEILSILEQMITKEFGKNPGLAEFYISPEEHYRRVQNIRKLLLKNIQIPLGFLQIFEKFPQLELSSIRIDYPRFRAITTYGHTLEEAKPAYFLHRDTWYGNSKSQINFWIPFQDITEQNCFHFYPEFFEKKIFNNSKLFSLSDWDQKGGFQNLSESHQGLEKTYPRNLENPIYPPIPFTMKKGEILAFSAHHLHGTIPNTSPQTRFSFEIRFILESDFLQNRGPLEVDNESVGNNFFSFRTLSDWQTLQ